MRKRLNGNAVYKVGDSRLVSFVMDSLDAPFLFWGRPLHVRGFDDALSSSMEDILNACPNKRWMAPLLSYTSMIANLGYLCDVVNATSAATRFPNAYFAHISGGCVRKPL